uniref:Uncharacterized protein n=1 Tax=Malurus cyaneus samueli TaxID=2593467 RepID=A0A8C5X6U9_9PASS
AGSSPHPPDPLCHGHPISRRFLTSKEQFHAYLRAGGEEEEEEERKKDEKKEEEQIICQSEPPAKRVKAEDGESQGNGGMEEEKERPEKKRARGQNKSRPCMKPNSYEQSRLCPSRVHPPSLTPSLAAFPGASSSFFSSFFSSSSSSSSSRPCPQVSVELLLGGEEPAGNGVARQRGSGGCYRGFGALWKCQQ